jgi:hypothetical protein
LRRDIEPIAGFLLATMSEIESIHRVEKGKKLNSFPLYAVRSVRNGESQTVHSVTRYSSEGQRRVAVDL